MWHKYLVGELILCQCIGISGCENDAGVHQHNPQAQVLLCHMWQQYLTPALPHYDHKIRNGVGSRSSMSISQIPNYFLKKNSWSPEGRDLKCYF